MKLASTKKVKIIGVDVARDLGAERLIVVNVGTPLMKRAEIGSLVNSADQMLRILTGQNVEASLATLSPQDVLIVPDLGALGSTDFANGYRWIAAAESATRRSARELAAYSVSPAEYAAWRTQQRVARAEPLPNHIEVDTSALRRVPPAAISTAVGPSPTDAEATVGALLATDDFETVKVDLHPHWSYLAGPGSATAAALFEHRVLKAAEQGAQGGPVIVAEQAEPLVVEVPRAAPSSPPSFLPVSAGRSPRALLRPA